MPPLAPIVFVVDDDVSIRESLRALVRSLGWRAETFASAREFLARPPVLAPSCLVLDVGLPDISGLDLQPRVAADHAHLPIIFVSGHGDVPTTVRAMKGGAVEFLTKPFDDATFEQSAEAFENPDHVDVVIHNYRWRLGLAPGEPRYDELERKLAEKPVIGVPTLTIASDFDGPAASGAPYAARFTGKHVHRILEGIGHNVPQEAPQAFAAAVREVDRL